MKFARTVVSVCSSFKSYREIRDLPVTSSVKYLLKLIAVLAVVLMAGFIPWAFEWGDEFARWVDGHFPAFSIQDGKIVTSVEQPYLSGGSNFLFVLDTTGQITQPDPKAMQGVLFMADSFLVWGKASTASDAQLRSQRHSLRGFPEGTVNGDYFRKLIRTFLWAGLPLFLLVVVLLGLLSALLQAYLFSAVASLMERSMPAPLTLQQLLNISIHAVTPAAIIVTVYMAMRLEGITPNALWLIYLIAYGIFLVGATNACRDTPRSSVAEA